MALSSQGRRNLKSLLKKADLDFHCPHCGASTPIDDHLIENSPALEKREHGAPEKGNDDVALEGIEYAVRLIARILRKKRKPAIAFVANSIYLQSLKDSKGRPIAKSPEALAKRWEDKLRKGGFHKRPDSSLAPRGILFHCSSRGLYFYLLPDDPVSN
jgi:hypothetical protein